MLAEDMAADEDWRGKSGALDAEEIAAFLGGPQIARLACHDLEGWPYVVPCWQEWDGGGWWLIPRERSAWATFLEHDPRCAIVVDDDGAQRKVIAQCRAELVERPNVGGQWVAIGMRMAQRYLGPNSQQYFEPTSNRPRWLFYLRPRKLVTWQGQDWARRYK
jgi:hypothetical protein